MITPHWIENGQGDHGLVFLHGVSGGAAGALPPVIAWAAITNAVSVEAIVLFLII